MASMPEEGALPETSTAYDAIAFQTVLAQTHECIKSELQRQCLDPLRYIVEIDAGLPIFATRDTHQLRISYNNYRTLSAEMTITHNSMVEQTGKLHVEFLSAVESMVLALREQVEAAGRPI